MKHSLFDEIRSMCQQLGIELRDYGGGVNFLPVANPRGGWSALSACEVNGNEVHFNPLKDSTAEVMEKIRVAQDRTRRISDVPEIQ
jgi:hypothetical protein